MIERIIEGRERDIGGFAVRRVLPHAKRRFVGPFVFLDQIGPAEMAPGTGIDVRPHPHIGLATVTYLFAGEMDHRDSLGAQQTIRPGDVNWMTSGRGITHSERTGPQARAAGHVLHGVQTWVALPVDQEECEPAFHHHPAAALPAFDLGGAKARLILGRAWGRESPVAVASPIFYVHAEAPAGADFEMTDEHADRAVYAVSGEAEVAGTRIEAGSLAVLEPGGRPRVRALSDARLMLLGGEPFPEKRHIWWNFVSSRESRIEQAKADWRASAAAGFRNSAFSLPPGETEHIPLPGEEQADGRPPRRSREQPTT